MAKCFLDINVLIYTINKKEKEKTEISRNTVKHITVHYVPVNSRQVLQEFYQAATAKLKLDKILVKNIVHSYTNMEVVTIDPATIEQAINISIVNPFHDDIGNLLQRKCL